MSWGAGGCNNHWGMQPLPEPRLQIRKGQARNPGLTSPSSHPPASSGSLWLMLIGNQPSGGMEWSMYGLASWHRARQSMDQVCGFTGNHTLEHSRCEAVTRMWNGRKANPRKSRCLDSWQAWCPPHTNRLEGTTLAFGALTASAVKWVGWMDHVTFSGFRGKIPWPCCQSPSPPAQAQTGLGAVLAAPGPPPHAIGCCARQRRTLAWPASGTRPGAPSFLPANSGTCRVKQGLSWMYFSLQEAHSKGKRAHSFPESNSLTDLELLQLQVLAPPRSVPANWRWNLNSKREVSCLLQGIKSCF